jgi:hypothetical protein
MQYATYVNALPLILAQMGEGPCRGCLPSARRAPVFWSPNFGGPGETQQKTHCGTHHQVVGLCVQLF